MSCTEHIENTTIASTENQHRFTFVIHKIVADNCLERLPFISFNRVKYMGRSIGSSLKWTFFAQSGRSKRLKLNDHVQKTLNGRFAKVDGPEIGRTAHFHSFRPSAFDLTRSIKRPKILDTNESPCSSTFKWIIHFGATVHFGD